MASVQYLAYRLSTDYSLLPDITVGADAIYQVPISQSTYPKLYHLRRAGDFDIIILFYLLTRSNFKNIRQNHLKVLY